MRLSQLLLFVILSCPGLALAQGYVNVNEILADNGNKNNLANEVNEFGNTSDWIELCNPSGANADLFGLHLIKGDNLTSSPRFIFTNHVIVPGDGYFRIWCDKDNTNVTGITDYHTGFSLDKNGDTVMLVDADGASILDRIDFGLQLTDYSLGRSWDGWGQWTLTVPTPGGPNQVQELGDPMELRINEWSPTNWNQWLNIIEHPNDTNAADCGHCKSDWVEIYNMSSKPVALAISNDQALRLTVSPLPSNASNFWNYSFIEANGFRRFWADKNKKDIYDSDEVNFKLSHNSGETLTLTHYDGRLIDSVTFAGEGTIMWVATNGPASNPTNFTWYTQGRLPDGDTNNPFVLFPVVFTNGNITTDKSTPEESNFLTLTNGVYINEVLAHTDPPLQDAVEFINTSTNPANISYYWFSNNRDRPRKFQIPAGTIIPAGGFKVLYEYQFNSNFTDINPQFTLNSAVGDSAYLFSATANGTLTGYRRGLTFESSANGVSFGRYTNSEGNVDFVAMSRLTFGSSVVNTDPPTTENWRAFTNGLGTNNSYPLVGPIVISEIMYHPPDIIDGTNRIDNSLDEYLELYNMSSNTVSLYDTEPLLNAYTNRWRIHSTVDYTFPTNQQLSTALVLRPGQFLLLVNFAPWEPTNGLQLAHFRDIYKLPASFTNIYGPYHGKLANKGGTLELYRPDFRQTQGAYINYVPQILVERVDYNDKAPWPTNADGAGYALQRIFPQGYGNDPTNWMAALPSPGSQATQIDSVTRASNNVTLSFRAWPNLSYTVQRTRSLVGNSGLLSSWTTVSNLLAQATFGTRQVSDTVTPGQNAFYRLVAPTQ